jgi:hypothetical protein
MRNPYRARVDERHFLNLPGFHGGAYVRAYVEDTSECPIKRDRGSGRPYNTDPRLILEMADCERRIALEFELYNSVRRMNSFHKIDTLIAALVAFRDGMAAEAELYRARDAEIDAEIEAAPPGAYANDDEDDDRDDHELDRDEEDAAAMNE